MTPEQWRRLKIVFGEAIDQPTALRRAWLAEECQGDPELLREAEALLRTHDTAGDFLEEPIRVDPDDVEMLPAGTEIGAYRIEGTIARGGMGVVYRAEDVRLGRQVALKALPAAVASQPELRERLRREARAAATISHPSVATVYALEEIGDHLYIASELVTGDTLRQVIDRGALPPERARRIASDVAGALAAAHDAGVIHRDLKPENVIVKPDGSVKVVDFGIAHMEGTDASRLTKTGFALGTPAYMAPEQLLGATADRRADIYALGIVLSEMLTGRHPLAPGSDTAARDMSGGAMATIIGRCLQPDPAARYGTAHELVGALGAEPPPAAVSGASAPAIADGSRQALWWWRFHQIAAGVVYSLMLIPVGFVRDDIGGTAGRVYFVGTLAAAWIATILRLHLWFASRVYERELTWVHDRAGRWIRVSDWIVALALGAGALFVHREHSPLVVLLPSVAIGVIVSFLFIEPVTAKAAFGRKQ